MKLAVPYDNGRFTEFFNETEFIKIYDIEPDENNANVIKKTGVLEVPGEIVSQLAESAALIRKINDEQQKVIEAAEAKLTESGQTFETPEARGMALQAAIDPDDDRRIEEMINEARDVIGGASGSMAEFLANCEINMLLACEMDMALRQAIAAQQIRILIGAEGDTDEIVKDLADGKIKVQHSGCGGCGGGCGHHGEGHGDGEGCCGHHGEGHGDGEGCCGHHGEGHGHDGCCHHNA